jgi:predicted transcriptional regulator
MTKKKQITLAEIIKVLSLKVECGNDCLTRTILGGYVSDLLSDVMAQSHKGDIWITLQGHPNTVAVAVLKELVGIIMVNGHEPDPETVNKAQKENIPIMTTNLPAFEIAGRLFGMGISGLR